VDLEKSLIASQIYLERGKVEEALDVFEKLPREDRFRTGILSGMVTLCLATDNRQRAAKLLKEAVDWNNKQVKGAASAGDMNIVWRKAAEFHLKGKGQNETEALIYPCLQATSLKWRQNPWKNFYALIPAIGRRWLSWCSPTPGSTSQRL